MSPSHRGAPAGLAIVVSSLTVIALFVFREPLLEPMRGVINPWILGLAANVVLGIGFLWVGISKNSFTQSPAARRFALAAAALAFMSIAGVVFGLDKGYSADWAGLIVQTLSTIAVVGFAIVVVAERHRPHSTL